MIQFSTNTFIDEWLEEAEQRGIEKGRQEGLQEGLLEGELAAEWRLLLLLLERRFGTVPVRLVLRINELSVDQLNQLFERALDASSLDEIDRAITEMLAGR